MSATGQEQQSGPLTPTPLPPPQVESRYRNHLEPHVNESQNGNAVAMLTLNVLSALPQQAEAIGLVRALYQKFEDVRPTLEPFPDSVGSA